MGTVAVWSWEDVTLRYESRGTQVGAGGIYDEHDDFSTHRWRGKLQNLEFLHGIMLF